MKYEELGLKENREEEDNGERERKGFERYSTIASC